MIKQGSIVKIHYIVSVKGQTVEDTQKTQKPVSYVQGQNQVLPEVQKHLEGHASGDVCEFVLSPDQAYGDYKAERVETIPKSEVPQVDQVKSGMYLQEKQKDGRVKAGRVVEVNDEGVVIDFNHPMAGKSLNYKVKIIDVIHG